MADLIEAAKNMNEGYNELKALIGKEVDIIDIMNMDDSEILLAKKAINFADAQMKYYSELGGKIAEIDNKMSYIERKLDRLIKLLESDKQE